MIKTLTRTGNSLALVLDRPLLERTNIDENTQLEISTDGRVIVIAPVQDKKRAAKIKAIVADLDERYAGAFRRLAK